MQLRGSTTSGVLALGGVVIALLATGLTAAAIAHHVDSMYKTPRANYDCRDRFLLCQTDNAELTVFRQNSIGIVGKQQIRATLDNSYDNTDLDVRYQDPPQYAGPTETDVIYRVGDVPGTAIGTTFCDDAVTTTKCDQHYVTFQNQPDQLIACHETGHAVGLLHPTEANPPRSSIDPSFNCMTTLALDFRLGTHNVSQINGTY